MFIATEQALLAGGNIALQVRRSKVDPGSICEVKPESVGSVRSGNHSWRFCSLMVLLWREQATLSLCRLNSEKEMLSFLPFTLKQAKRCWEHLIKGNILNPFSWEHQKKRFYWREIFYLPVEKLRLSAGFQRCRRNGRDSSGSVVRSSGKWFWFGFTVMWEKERIPVPLRFCCGPALVPLQLEGGARPTQAFAAEWLTWR